MSGFEQVLAYLSEPMLGIEAPDLLKQKYHGIPVHTVLYRYFGVKMVLPLCGSPFPPSFWQYLLLAVSHGTEKQKKEK